MARQPLHRTYLQPTGLIHRPTARRVWKTVVISSIHFNEFLNPSFGGTFVISLTTYRAYIEHTEAVLGPGATH